MDGEKSLTFRRYEEGETPDDWDLEEKIFQQDTTYKCPTYIHRTPPCQGSCPAGEDIRGWLNIVRGIEKPPVDADGNEMDWKDYAFLRSTDANPFPAIMGRVCPAPCQDGCNRNEVEQNVGINAVEHFIGDHALETNLPLRSPGADTGKSIALIGGGIASLTAAYQLRRMGHAATIFEAHSKLGGMMRYGIPGYRTPRDVLDGEIQRVLDMGVEVKTGVKIGVDISLAKLEEDYDAVFVGIGAQSGTPIPIPGADKASNCITGVAFLEAFNDGRLQHGAQKVLVIGGGDTAMDVAAVARRLGHIEHSHEQDRPEFVVLGHTAHDVATVAKRDGADVKVIYRRPVDKMPATEMEVKHVREEGVEIHGSLVPVEVVLGDDGRARALKVAKADWSSGKMEMIEGSEHEIEADLIVAAIGQAGDLKGMEELDNGWGLVNANANYQWPDRENIFVAGDIIKPHLLTTAVGQASIAAKAIDQFLKGEKQGKPPKVNVHHFNLLEKLKETNQAPTEYAHAQTDGTDSAEWAVHNYEDRAANQIVPADELFLGHWEHDARFDRKSIEIGPEAVLGHFGERIEAPNDEEARKEADRCMSCGMCFECDNCVIYCPQDAVHRVKKSDRTTGRYVDTDYSKCIGCHICADVCPSGYIKMGLGE
ncbi:NAD(P)-binding protein [Alisedimentitalea sp. MJ-SS2]|uniref:NAD(P)-binding protein n=1 Tax=Aliisedimentitalea sp. MJ-SS2 TaxID=3049795 RepID=UPI00290B1D5F|nr:NAD(P)-binding protein [Alisedimentitalea sp. MJ-SS2]MDU8926198.1 NAD(P)-binding protein [Alisedimentitalea sp. MJ-SS2]